MEFNFLNKIKNVLTKKNFLKSIVFSSLLGTSLLMGTQQAMASGLVETNPLKIYGNDSVDTELTDGNTVILDKASTYHLYRASNITILSSTSARVDLIEMNNLLNPTGSSSVESNSVTISVSNGTLSTTSSNGSLALKYTFRTGYSDTSPSMAYMTMKFKKSFQPDHKLIIAYGDIDFKQKLNYIVSNGKITNRFRMSSIGNSSSPAMGGNMNFTHTDLFGGARDIAGNSGDFNLSSNEWRNTVGIVGYDMSSLNSLMIGWGGGGQYKGEDNGMGTDLFNGNQVLILFQNFNLKIKGKDADVYTQDFDLTNSKGEIVYPDGNTYRLKKDEKYYITGYFGNMEENDTNGTTIHYKTSGLISANTTTGRIKSKQINTVSKYGSFTATKNGSITVSVDHSKHPIGNQDVYQNFDNKTGNSDSITKNIIVESPPGITGLKIYDLKTKALAPIKNNRYQLMAGHSYYAVGDVKYYKIKKYNRYGTYPNITKEEYAYDELYQWTFTNNGGDFNGVNKSKGNSVNIKYLDEEKGGDKARTLDKFYFRVLDNGTTTGSVSMTGYGSSATSDYDIVQKDIIYKNVELIDLDTNKSTTTNDVIEIGHRYKLKYSFTSTGEKAYAMKSSGTTNQGNPIYSIAEEYKRKVGIEGVYNKYSSKNTYGEKPLPTGKLESEFALHGGETFVLESGSLEYFEVPALKTNNVFFLKAIRNKTGGAYSKMIDSNTGNDDFTAEWLGNQNIYITDVKIDSEVEKLVKNSQKIPYNVTYNINSTSDTINKGKNEDVKVEITDGNGTVHKFTDHFVWGENRTFTHTIYTTYNMSDNLTKNVSISIDTDNEIWEHQNGKNYKPSSGSKNTVPFIDNHDVTNNKAVNIVNQKIQGQYNLLNTQPNQNLSNSWTTKQKWYTYTNKQLTGGIARNFKFFTKGNDTDTTLNNTENFKITKIMFRSKLSTDLKLGANKDGWVDLLKETGKIKAGYGYELQITTEYDTNAYTNEKSKNTDESQLSSSKTISNFSTDQYFVDDIYYTTPDKKYLSLSGINGSVSKFTILSQSGDRNKRTVTYEFKQSKSVGGKVNKYVYFNKNTKDGIYEFMVGTPYQNGVNNTQTTKNPLVDVRKVKIEVVGSMYDDLKDHIIQ